MSTHSPGPWHYGLSADGGRVNVYTDETMSLRIARVDSGPDIGIDAKANARLIACAPELAVIAQRFVDYLEDNEQSSWADDVRAVLSKAGVK